MATVVNKGYFIRQLEKTAPTLDALSDTIVTIDSQNVVIKLLDGTSALPM